MAKIPVHEGDLLPNVIQKMIETAAKTGVLASADFNGITIYAHAESDPQLVELEWSLLYERMMHSLLSQEKYELMKERTKLLKTLEKAEESLKHGGLRMHDPAAKELMSYLTKLRKMGTT